MRKTLSAVAVAAALLVAACGDDGDSSAGGDPTGNGGDGGSGGSGGGSAEEFCAAMTSAIENVDPNNPTGGVPDLDPPPELAEDWAAAESGDQAAAMRVVTFYTENCLGDLEGLEDSGLGDAGSMPEMPEVPGG